jgi:hypothetical protein
LPDDERAIAVADEERRARVRSLTRAEAEELVEAARRRILQLFPDGEDTYDLILAPRFARLVREYAPGPVPRRKLLRFRAPG